MFVLEKKKSFEDDNDDHDNDDDGFAKPQPEERTDSETISARLHDAHSAINILGGYKFQA